MASNTSETSMRLVSRETSWQLEQECKSAPDVGCDRAQSEDGERESTASESGMGIFSDSGCGDSWNDSVSNSSHSSTKQRKLWSDMMFEECDEVPSKPPKICTDDPAACVTSAAPGPSCSQPQGPPGCWLRPVLVQVPEASLHVTGPPGTHVAQCPQMSSEMGQTTLHLQNLPAGIRREDLCKMLNVQGFAGMFDFVYAPINVQTWSTLGHALVNFVDGHSASAALRQLQGFAGWEVPLGSGAQGLEVSWSATQQGLEALVEKHRNSPEMHQSVAERHRPLLFHCGFQVMFPAPTKRIRLHRLISKKHREAEQESEKAAGC